MKRVALVVCLLATIVVISGCGGGGGGQIRAPGTYTMSVLAVPPKYNYSQAWFIDGNGRTIGIVGPIDQWDLGLCMWDADGRNLRVLEVPDEVLHYVETRWSWGPSTPFMRVADRDLIAYYTDDGSSGVADLLRGNCVPLTNLPGASVSKPADVNDAGVCVGSYESDAFPSGSMPMMWFADGTPRELAVPEGCECGHANAINNSGQMVGNVTDWVEGQLTSVPIVWNPDGTIARKIPLTEGAEGLLISDSGYVVIHHPSGIWTTYDEIVSPTGNTVQLVDPRGPSFVHVKAINSRGQAVGNSDNGPVVCSPDGTVTALPVPSGNVTCGAEDIDDNGVIVGYVETRNPDRTYAVRWVPN